MHSFKELVEKFETRLAKTLPFPEQPSGLYEPCRYFLQIGGKGTANALCYG